MNNTKTLKYFKCVKNQNIFKINDYNAILNS